jgi:hypothetical protein
MRELDLIKSLESDNRDFELLAIYFEEAVTEVSFTGGPTITGKEKARQLRERIAENEALMEQITSAIVSKRTVVS